MLTPRLAIPALAVVFLAGCASSAVQAGSGGGSTSAMPAPTSAAAPVTSAPPTSTAPAVQVDASDNSHTIMVAPGQLVSVQLSSGELWAAPTSSNASVLAVTASSVDQGTGDAMASFRAGTSGTATIRSSHRCLPKGGAMCAQYIALWTVIVDVS